MAGAVAALVTRGMSLVVAVFLIITAYTGRMVLCSLFHTSQGMMYYCLPQ